MRKIYLTLGVSAGALALGSIGAAAFGLAGVPAFFVGALGLIPCMQAMYVSPEQTLWRHALFGVGVILCGAFIGTVFSALGIPSDLAALIGLEHIVAGYWLVAALHKVPSQDTTLLRYGGFALGGLLFAASAILLNLVDASSMGVLAPYLEPFKTSLFDPSLYVGLTLTSMWVAHDSKFVLERVTAGETDHIRAVCKVPRDAMRAALHAIGWVLFLPFALSTYSPIFSQSFPC